MNTRSRRQQESLRHARDWHLSMALRAKLEGKISEADFHMRYYHLLGPAVEMEDESSDSSAQLPPGMPYDDHTQW